MVIDKLPPRDLAVAGVVEAEEEEGSEGGQRDADESFLRFFHIFQTRIFILSLDYCRVSTSFYCTWSIKPLIF